MAIPKGFLNMPPEQFRAAYGAMSPEERAVLAALDQTLSRAEKAEAALQAKRNDEFDQAMAVINRAAEQRREIERLEAERSLIEQRHVLLETEQRHRNAVPESKPIDPAPTGDIKPDTPLRLEDAARLAYPDGSMTASGLRKLGKQNLLRVERTRNRDYTTLRAIEEMRQASCRNAQGDPASGSNLQPTTSKASSDAARRGSSEMTERAKSARAALLKTAQALSESSTTTSQANTASPAIGTVIPLKSSS
jgi:hypothetical protein